MRAPPPLPNFSFIDIFAGVGGFRVGLEAVGGRCVWSCEIDYAARAAYGANHGVIPYHDVRRADPSLVPPFTVLTAGFPCQDFSTLGKQKGLQGDKGALFFEVIRFLRTHQPDVAFLENVRGLVTMEGGAVFARVIQELVDQGYTVRHKLINSSILVPQYRNRVYIIAFRDAAAAARFEFPQLPELAPAKRVAERRGKDTTAAKAKRKERRKAAARQKAAEEAAVAAGLDPSEATAAPVKSRVKTLDQRPHPRIMAEILEPKDDPFLVQHYLLAAAAWRRVRTSKTVARYGLMGRLVQLNGIGDTLLSSYRLNAHSFAQFVPMHELKPGLLRSSERRAHGASSKGGDKDNSGSGSGSGSGNGSGNGSGPSVPEEGGAEAKTASEGGAGAADSTESMTPREKELHMTDGTVRVRPRWLTPRECHRMMGFPEDYRVHPNDAKAYSQMGNAVTPPIIALLGGHIMAALQQDEAQQTRYVASSYSAAIALAAASTPADGRRRALLQRRVTVARGVPGTVGANFSFDGVAWQLVAAGDSPLARHLYSTTEAGARGARCDTPDEPQPFPVCSCLLRAHTVWRYGGFSGSPLERGRRRNGPPPAACRWCVRGEEQPPRMAENPPPKPAGAAVATTPIAVATPATAQAGNSALRTAIAGGVLVALAVVAGAVGGGWLASAESAKRKG